MLSQTEPLATRPTSLTHIETLCADYNDTSTQLEQQLAALETELAAVKQKHLPALKRQAAAVTASEADLHRAVEAAPKLFLHPRTHTAHGVKVGYTTSIGCVTWADDAKVITLIKRHFKAHATQLIKTTETPRKDTLRLLSTKDLAKLGCQIQGAGDLTLVKRLTGAAEKLADTILAQA